MSAPLVIVGDSLLDVDVEGTADRLCPDAPVPVVEGQAEHHRPGGAGLAALLAARDGTQVTLVTAVGDDPSGRCLEDLLSPTVEIVRLPLRGTTVRKTRVRARGQTLVRIDTGDGRAMGRPGQVASASAFARAADALASAGAVLVADYGRGVADLLRELLRGLDVPVVWDPHPRGSLPVPGCALVTPSEAEARGMCGEPYVSPERTARRLVRDLDAEAVAITLGERGAMLARRGGRFGPVPAPHVAVGADACGAGDRFAAAAALALADGASTEDAVARAVGEATRFVADGGAAALRLPRPAAEAPVPFPPGASAFEVAAAVRASGGRLIATGGCFDLLHAGHVSLLRRARALGDALVVCVNSDDSIRRLKGPSRPLVSERDRVEVLRALGFVDAVTVFGEDTPSQVIERLCPDVWVKGGDYDERSMPEAEAVRRAGGEVVILPTVPGYSTTGLIAAARAAS
ncbi:PfkB family carbohydrate kinase [Microbispora triticiradicis]|uniref:Bifunctional heptose 7-phosphate kinase/heptose 1-phosphate adenyltransferase n=2 Tax=Microbispora TaxID=2005 RepID=A0ABY3LYS3_9ACTN|nr:MULTISPECIES: PfkB family carbohydrate kinase [Microbispora]TLP56325.1 bifunctional heptose 7-phosphate kinase/heptose 1-phosphate adenyltransferase [Microbispora fusca]TYB59023.1 bifunctional heptose 7-phosphate kinase/heptose 1-phosphate adenyltransferase [Microbispora tritici]